MLALWKTRSLVRSSNKFKLTLIGLTSAETVTEAEEEVDLVDQEEADQGKLN